MLDFYNRDTRVINQIIANGGEAALTEVQFLEREILKFKASRKRKIMLDGGAYYVGQHDIIRRKRTAIGEDGELDEIDNLPNNRNIDNQYAKLVDQKKNYLLSNPPTFETDNETYGDTLKTIFNNRFMRKLKNLGEDSLNEGIAWLYPYYDEIGEFRFKRFPGASILPFWKDEEHTELDCAVRIYAVEVYDGKDDVIVEKVEFYTLEGIKYYIFDHGKLVPDDEAQSSAYIITKSDDGNGVPLNWERIPLIPFKYNNKEIPLIQRVKTLQDALNALLSDFHNNMQEDARNTIIVIKNYDGTDLGQFRYNLATYGAIKVNDDGGIDTLTVEVNAENYQVILEIFKKAIIENGRGYDAKDDRLSGNPNQMNIQSMYSDIDLDANDMETEYQAAFEELLWFVNAHLANTGQGDFSKEEVKVVFNRNVLINTSEMIENCSKSLGVISDKTIVAKHPWVTDVDEELDRLQEEQAAMNEYTEAFNNESNNEA